MIYPARLVCDHPTPLALVLGTLDTGRGIVGSDVRSGSMPTMQRTRKGEHRAESSEVACEFSVGVDRKSTRQRRRPTTLASKIMPFPVVIRPKTAGITTPMIAPLAATISTVSDQNPIRIPSAPTP